MPTERELKQISYKLLGLLQEVAPTGKEQQELTEAYHELQKDFPENEVIAHLAGILIDGYRHGNWPWVIKADLLGNPTPAGGA